MTAGEQVRHYAPKGAHYYKLNLSLSDGTLRFYPSDGVSFYFVGNEPPPLAGAEYSVAYYDVLMNLVPLEKEVIIDLDSRTQTAHLTSQLDLMNGHGAPERVVAKANQGADQRTRQPPKLPSVHSEPSTQRQPRAEDSSDRGAEVAEPKSDNEEETDEDEDEDEPKGPDKPRAEAEPDQDSALETAQLLRMQMKMRQQEHEFIRTSLHTREVGEVYQLSTIQRQGLVESQKLAHVVHSQRVAEVTRLSEAFLRIMDRYEDKLKTPPPPPPPPAPPPDYMGAITAGLGMIQNIATAFMAHKVETMRLVTGGAPQEPPDKAPVSRQATPKSGRASDSAPADLPGEHPLRDVPSRAKKPEPAPFRMMAKALAMDDAELALGLSTPEGMKVLFEKMSKLATSGDPITRAIDEQEGE